MRKKGLLLALAALLAVVLVLAGCSSSGQGKQTADKQQKEAPKYPTRQIEYVVPAAAGGGTDLIARAVAEYMSKEWGQSVVVVNKPGGGCAIGSEYAVKQAKPDGYTVLADIQSSTSMLVGGMVNPPVKIEDRAYMSRIIQDPIAFAVKADAPWKDFKEFSEWVKKNPAELTWASVGPAGLSAYGVADWLNAIGVDFTKTRMVSTGGAAESIPQVAGGHVVLAVHTVAEVYPMAKAGKIRVLAIQAPERSPYMPGVPTVEEQGVKGMTVKWWTGVTSAAGTPDYVVKKWDETIAKMIKDPVFQEKAKNLHVNISYMNSADFAKFVKDETDYYTKMSSKLGIRK